MNRLIRLLVLFQAVLMPLVSGGQILPDDSAVYYLGRQSFQVIHACGGTIYDDGGPDGCYSNSVNSTMVVYPSQPGFLVSLYGTYSSESCDILKIYDGSNATGTLLFQARGAGITVPTITSTTGPLTLWFRSDFSVQDTGFTLHLDCAAIPGCRSISRSQVSQVQGTSALLDWSLTGPSADPSHFIVTLRNDDSLAAPLFTDITSLHYYFFSGLTPFTHYTATVSAVCDSDTIVGDPQSFYTTCLAGGNSAMSGFGRDTLYYVPVAPMHGNSLCQSIYTAADLLAMGLTAGPLEGVTYTWSSRGQYPKELVIYVNHTSRSSYTSYDPIMDSNLTEYYRGIRDTNAVGTTEYRFTTPFVWDGVSNVAVTTFINQPAGQTHYYSRFYAYCTRGDEYRTCWAFQDALAITPTTRFTQSWNNGISTYRPNISFIRPCDTTADCAAPNVLATSVLSDSVTLVWSPGGIEGSWDVYYRQVSDTAWTMAAAGVVPHTYTFGGLAPATTYLFRVVPDCGGDSVSAIVQLTTDCASISELPFVEDFEHFTAPSDLGSPITPCWHRGSTLSFESTPSMVNVSASHGNKSLYFSSRYNTHFGYIALPAMADEVRQLSICFSYKVSVVNGMIDVGVMDDPEDINTFTLVSQEIPSVTGAWVRVEVPLSGYLGTGRYIALRVTGMGGCYLDDIQVERTASCPRPNPVTVTNIGTTTATVHWSNSMASLFEVEYGLAGFAHGTGTTVSSIGDSIVLTLNHSSRYDVYVRAICSISDTSDWSFAYTFNTDCSAINELPYTENFTSPYTVPYCWICGGRTGFPAIQRTTDEHGNETASHLEFFSESDALPTVASLPALHNTLYPIDRVHLYFDGWSDCLGSRRVIVGACTLGGNYSTFTPSDTIELTPVPTTYEVNFTTISGAGQYITFVCIPERERLGYQTSICRFSLDNVAVELLPDCLSPNRLEVLGVTTTTATLAWDDRDFPLSYEVEYGPVGFAPGSGVRVTAYTNPVTITGLSPSSTYEFTVRNICTVFDTSLWALPRVSFATMQVPAVIPYSYDFESDTEWCNWQTNSNCDVNWYRGTAAGNHPLGTGTYSMFVSASAGSSYGSTFDRMVNASAYRDIDFGARDTAVQLTFSARVGGTTYDDYDGLAVFLADPAQVISASYYSSTSPWGEVSHLPCIALLHRQPDWHTYTVTLDSISGVHRLVFFWFNRNCNVGLAGGPGVVDDIDISYITCPNPTNLRLLRAGSVATDLAWFGPSDANYHVVCSSSDSVVYDQLVLGNTVHLQGLMPLTRYTVEVRRICDTADSSAGVARYTFTTINCDGGYLDTLVSANCTTTYQLPIVNLYHYSYTQQIIPAELIHGQGQISAIYFKYEHANANTSKTNCTIYLSHTSRTAYHNYHDYEDPEQMQLVYTGPIICTRGWNRVELAYPFDYDGSSNLCLAIADKSGGNHSSQSFAFSADRTEAFTAMAMYSPNNFNTQSIAALDEASASRSLLALRSQMQLVFCPSGQCPAPRLRKPLVRPSGVTLRWYAAPGVHYQLSYRRVGSNQWFVDNEVVADTFYRFPDASWNTDNTYRVRHCCDSANVSNYSIGTFNTADVPCLSPMGLRVTDVTDNSATFYWEPEENNITYHLRVFNSAFDRVVNSHGAHTAVRNLYPATTYYAAVQAECQDFDEPSEWSDTIVFTTNYCPDAFNLTYSQLQGNSVLLDWDDGGDAIGWEVSFGPHGFTQGEGYTVFADHHPYLLDQLTGETDYDIYVRAQCGEGLFSEHWSDPVRVITPFSAIASATDDSRVCLFPNPTSGDVELALPEVEGVATVSVIDLAGRTLVTLQLPAGTERAVLPSAQLAPGAYFVRIASSSISMVKKLVVR